MPPWHRPHPADNPSIPLDSDTWLRGVDRRSNHRTTRPTGCIRKVHRPDDEGHTDMKQAKFRSHALQSATLLLAALAACGGSSSKTGNIGFSGAKPELQSIEVGRLVDIYAYQRIDQSEGDRRRRFNRKLVLVAQNVVVNPSLESQTLFDAGGAEVSTATYEFRPFDKSIGHEELIILWDNQALPGDEALAAEDREQTKFQRALSNAQTGLPSLAAAYRGQNTMLRPIPVVPRNAALRLRFSSPLTVNERFFQLNPTAIQLLEFKGDPAVVEPVNAFRLLPCRVIPQANFLVVDTTILGGEGSSGFTTSGLPASTDSVTANIRIAIPTRGSAVSSFYVKDDTISELNGPDSVGRNSVIRDFRSGNLSDGAAGKLFEAESPMIVGSMAMGIMAIDPAERVLTLNKRQHFVPIRGRYPFVDGPLDSNGLPLGPVSVPIAQPLRTGDVLTQTRLIEMPDGTFETITLRAEILENLEIGAHVGGSLPLGLSSVTVAGQEQGQLLTTARVRVASLEAGRDSLGRTYSFEASTDPLGRDCVLRALYYEDVAFVGSTLAVSDANWRHQFLRIDPQPPTSATPGTQVNPISSMAVEFTKPVDLDQVDNTANLLLTNTSINTETFSAQMDDPKKATARVVPTRLSDVAGDGTVIRLQAPMGLFHQTGTTETYCFHVKLGTDGVTDLAGNGVKIYDSNTNPLASWSVDFQLNSAATSNNVGWHSWLFNSADEDGSLPGSVDIFGQYRLQNGRLYGAAGVRFKRTMDNQNISTISRIDGGECWDPTNDVNTFYLPTAVLPTDQNGATHPGLLYWQPMMLTVQNPPAVPQVYEYWQSLPQNVGRVIEPHNPRGSRMQMRYIEDDFSLDRRQAADMGIDVEQMYWSPFNDETVYYDVFDRYSMSLAHSERRPDIRFFLNPGNPNAVPPVPPFCQFACPSVSSALSTVFADNVLAGTTAVPVFEDKVYRINPNEAFRSSFNVKYVPFPRFDRSYTWRDSRLVTIDSSGQVIGLGGAQTPNAPSPNNDWTANIDSPWVTDQPDPEWLVPPQGTIGGTKWNEDPADFRGELSHDHDPIALPLLVDFKMFPDSAVNGVASGANSFQVAMLGPPSDNPLGNPGGYYDSWPAGCGGARPAWPSLRAQASGGEDLISGAAILIDPANQLQAQASILKDAGLGNATRALFTAPARDGMVNWSQADFVRKVSTMTFGFIDTLQPQRALFVNDPTGTPSVSASVGFPNLNAVNTNLRISDLVAQLDPPQARQPAGTGVVLEIRGAEDFANSTVLYNPSFDLAGQTPNDTFDGRGNLLNPNYACEAFRYSQANAGGGGDTPRILTTGLTPYVTENQIARIRDQATGLLPRFMNVRLTMTNNVSVTPSLSPSLRSMTLVYRMQPKP